MIKHTFLLMLFGLVVSGWGAGIISVHYIIGNSSPINTVNAVGIIIAGIGLVITIGTIRKLKGFWQFEEVLE